MNMTIALTLSRSRLAAWLGGLLCLWAAAAHAGNISFGLTLEGTTLTVVNQGDTSAFYTAALRLLGNGRWETLKPAPGAVPPAELAPGAQLRMVWPAPTSPVLAGSLESLQPVMVRFFDQAGADFGQISFFRHAADAPEQLRVQAGYVDGMMSISPPGNSTIRASWLIWPQEEGIAPLTSPVHLEHHQPNARRIEWRRGTGTQRFNLGKGLPMAFLLHETDQGYLSQIVGGGQMQGRQQRAGWLDASNRFYFLARLAAAAAAGLLAWHLLGAWRNRRAR